MRLKLSITEALREEMLKTTEALRLAQEKGEQTGEIIDLTTSRYWEGYLEALGLAVSLLMKENA